MNPEVTLIETLIGAVLAFAGAYLITVACAWWTGHRQPWQFWKQP